MRQVECLSLVTPLYMHLCMHMFIFTAAREMNGFEIGGKWSLHFCEFTVNL